MKLKVGSVLKAQGIKGEIKLSCFLDDPAMLCGISELYVGTNSYSVEHIRPDGAFCYVKFAEIADRNAAEALRGWTVYADKNSVPLPDGRYFVEDLVGCNVVADGEYVGTVNNVLQYGAADVFECGGGKKKVSFPFLKDVVLSVNVERKTISVDGKRFAEVAVYED